MSDKDLNLYCTKQQQKPFLQDSFNYGCDTEHLEKEPIQDVEVKRPNTNVLKSCL